MAEVIRITGLKELRAALKLVSESAPKELAKANQKVGEVVAERARELAPKGPHQGGGAITPIVDSIRATRSGTSVAVVAGGRGTPHAVVTEFGGKIPRRGFAGYNTRRRGLLNFGGGSTRVRKQAYLYPAVDEVQPAIEAEYLDMLGKLVEGFRR